MRTPVVHELKCESEFFTDIILGRKNIEIRKNDRDFMVGDILWLREYRTLPHTVSLYGGGQTTRRIIKIYEYFPGLLPGYIAMGIT